MGNLFSICDERNDPKQEEKSIKQPIIQTNDILDIHFRQK